LPEREWGVAHELWKGHHRNTQENASQFLNWPAFL
jgi:hypothetical protein